MSRILLSIVLMSTASVSAVANAQSADGANSGLDEILVTAERREQNIQKTPLSITALSAGALETANVTSTNGLVAITPGLQFASSGGFPQLFLRGIGNDRASNNESSTATYLDGVYISLSGAAIQDFGDVERVEVLRGPQGTLYGRNATGGAINIVTKKPSFETAGRVRLTAGSHDLLRGQVYLTGPVSQTVAASISGTIYRQDSFHRNVSPNKVSGYREEEEGKFVRGKILWTPGARFEAELSVDYFSRFGFDDAADRQIQANATGFAIGGISGSKPFDVAFSEQVGNKVEQYGGSFKTRTDLDFAHLVTISGYRVTDTFPRIDLGATDAVTFFADIDTRSRQFSQEIQLVSNASSPFDWIVGAYYFNEFQKNDPYRLTIRGLAAGTPRTFVDQLTRVKQDTDALAVFGQVTYPLTDRFSLVGGLRYSWEKRDVADFTVENLLTSVTTPYAGKEATFKKLTYKVGVNFQANNGLLLYANHSTGFKAGLFNLSNPSGDLGPVKPEEVDSYELGAKITFADGRARLNISAFHYDLSNLQVSTVATGAAVTLLRNAASANVTGGEAELQFNPAEGLVISASAALLDAKYASFKRFPMLLPATAPATGNAAVPTDLDGGRMFRSPKFTGTLDVRYSIPIGDNELRLASSLYHNSGYNFDPAGVARQPKYATVDASVSFVGANERWEVTVWGKNLTDKLYYQRISVYGAGRSANYAAPLTGGVTLAYNF